MMKCGKNINLKKASAQVQREADESAGTQLSPGIMDAHVHTQPRASLHQDSSGVWVTLQE